MIFFVLGMPPFCYVFCTIVGTFLKLLLIAYLEFNLCLFWSSSLGDDDHFQGLSFMFLADVLLNSCLMGSWYSDTSYLASQSSTDLGHFTMAGQHDLDLSSLAALQLSLLPLSSKFHAELFVTNRGTLIHPTCTQWAAGNSWSGLASQSLPTSVFTQGSSLYLWGQGLQFLGSLYMIRFSGEEALGRQLSLCPCCNGGLYRLNYLSVYSIEAGSCHVAQDILKLIIHLPHLPGPGITDTSNGVWSYVNYITTCPQPMSSYFCWLLPAVTLN